MGGIKYVYSSGTDGILIKIADFISTWKKETMKEIMN
jgi:hypothetical protein